MQDEYVYSMAARHLSLAETPHPNYLFSLVYRSTNLCGDQFYTCAKGVNAIFLLGIIALVWILAMRLFGLLAAVVASTATALSPISVYVSFFMPDTMFFFFVVLCVYLALRVAQKPGWQGWIFLASALGLTALVKPHIIFALPAYLIFSMIVMWKSQGGTWLRVFLQQTGMLLAFFVVRLGGGYLLAGPAGLSFFGPQYSAALYRFVGDSPEAPGPTQSVTPAPEATGNQNPTGQAELVQKPTVGEDFLEVFASQAVGQYAFIILLAGIPLFLGLRALKTVFVSSKPVGQQSAFVVLVALLGVVMIPAIAAFQGIAATFGESTDQAVVSRHYDFLIPLFLLAGFSISKFVEPSKKSRMIQAAIVALASVYSLIWLLNFVSPRVSDSSTLTGLLFSPVVFYLLVALVLATVALWAVQPAKTSNFIAKALIPLIFVSVGLLSQVSLHQYEGVEKANFDLAGEAAKPILKGVPGEQIVVVGVSRPALFTAKFWIDTPGVADAWVTSEDTEVSNIVSPYSYALVLGTFVVNTPNEVLAEGDGYKLLRIQR
jgi:phosphoglycerol transferase